jgi:hypothetical protein
VDLLDDNNEEKNMGGFNGSSLNIRSGFNLYAMQWWATWVKRANISLRQPIGFCFQIFTPILMGALLIILLRIIKVQQDGSDSISLKNSTNTNEQLMTMEMISYSKKLLIFTGTSDSWMQKSFLSSGLGPECRDTACTPSSLNNQLNFDASIMYCSCEGCPYESPNSADTTILPSGESLLSLASTWATQDRINEYLRGVNNPGLTGLIQESQGGATIWAGVPDNNWGTVDDIAQVINLHILRLLYF